MSDQSGSTIADIPENSTLARLRRAQIIRRLFLAILAIFLLAGLNNFAGVKIAKERKSSGGYELTVTYGKITRLGLATPWSVEVKKAGGFQGPVTLATTYSYFEIFDENSLDPEPTSATVDGDKIVWEFDPPEGDTLTVDFDARIEPTWHGGRSASTAVREGDLDVIEVGYRTRVMP